LELATGESNFELSDLYVEPAELVTWLERAGGESPREWLDQLRPLVSHYISESGSAPVSSETWKMIRSQSYNVPRIYVNEASHQVAVGGRQIPVETLPAKAYEMLVYLYRHGNEIVSKATLYYQAYLGMAHTPRTAADPGYEAPTSYDGLIDTNLWRLRQVIEPDPSNPVLLETVRGHGVRLVSRW
jgi:DNA-binding response OmpR family regulator